MENPVIDLPYPLTTHNNLAEKALRVPPEMILQIASGLDDPQAIALRYGYSQDEFTALAAWTPFQQEVAKVRAEFEKSGFDFVLDSRLKAKELSNVIFLRAMGHDATFGQVHDAFRTFTEFADLKPKPQNPQSQNPTAAGFSIQIVFADSTKHEKPAIDVTPTSTVEIPPKEVMGRRNPFTIDAQTE